MRDDIIAQSEKERDEFIKSRSSSGPSSTKELHRTYSPLYSIDEVLAQSDIQDEWLVDSIVLANGLTIVAGSPGHCKSMFSQFLAKSVASGEPFLDRFSSKPGKVLVVDREVPKARLKRRWSSLGNISGLPILFYPYSDSFKLDHTRDAERLIKLVKEKDIKLVIIDTFNRSHTGKDTNAASEVATVFEPVKALLELTSVIIVHHLNKGVYGKEMPTLSDLYGSIDFAAEADLVFALQKKNKTIAVYNLKSRETEEIKPFELTLANYGGLLDLNYEGEKEPSESSVEKREKSIVEILKRGKTKRADLISDLESLGENEKTVANSLTTLKNKGVIDSEIVGKEAYYFLPAMLSEPLPVANSIGIGKPGNIGDNTVTTIQNISQPVQEALRVGDMNSCHVCGGTNFWSRKDGGRVCSVCHPNPNCKEVQA